MSIALQEISIPERIVNAGGRFWTGSGNTDFSAPTGNTKIRFGARINRFAGDTRLFLAVKLLSRAFSAYSVNYVVTQH